MTPPVTAVYDANVLYPAPLRDLLMWLADVKLVLPRWTLAIHDEWVRNLLADRPDLSAERMARTRDRMIASVRNSLVTGYEPLIDTLALPDPGDRHVLAAAIHAGATAVVTFNLKDFPPAALAGHGVTAVHPDEFVLALLDVAPGDVLAAVERQRAGLRNPPKTTAELLATLEAQGLPRSVARLRTLVPAG